MCHVTAVQADGRGGEEDEVGHGGHDEQGSSEAPALEEVARGQARDDEDPEEDLAGSDDGDDHDPPNEYGCNKNKLARPY